MTFSDRLKVLREKRNLLQSELADKIGVARTTYASYEQGNREPAFEMLIVIADLFGVTTDYLLCRGNAVDTFDEAAGIQPIGAQIRMVRQQKKMTGTQVSELLGITPQYYYEIERGKRNLSAENAIRLADIFNVSTDYLLCRVNTYDRSCDRVKAAEAEVSRLQYVIDKIKDTVLEV